MDSIGNNSPVGLLRLIKVLESCFGCRTRKKRSLLQAGEVLARYADVDRLVRDVWFKPETLIGLGGERFMEWYGFRITVADRATGELLRKSGAYPSRRRGLLGRGVRRGCGL